MTAFVDMNDHFKTALAQDLLGMVVGRYDGYGTYRAIFDHATDASLIVKVENQSQSFSNVNEWNVWQAVKETKLARWFAPCVDISPRGIVLIARRCKPIPREMLPDKVPAFFTDLKVENWGLYEGRPVCLDYGCHLMLERGMTTKLRAARWTDHG